MRLARVRLPPCASAICLLKARPIPDPVGFVVKNGTNKLEGFAMPGPSSCTKTRRELPFLDHPIRTPHSESGLSEAAATDPRRLPVPRRAPIESRRAFFAPAPPLHSPMH